MTCPTEGQMVEKRIDRILTQYRESAHLLAVIRSHLAEIEEAAIATCPILEYFDIDTAVGDQLTIIGKWLGWPRYHCKGAKQAVFGFENSSCGACTTPDEIIIGGFCTSEWDGCPSSAYTGYEFFDDELYRRFLKSRAIQLFGDYRRKTLVEAIRYLFGASGAMLVRELPGKIVVSLGRPFEPGERQILHLYREVLPVALGIELVIRPQGLSPSGSDWRTIDGDEEARVTDDGFVRTVSLAGENVFGFCDGWGEFCASNWGSNLVSCRPPDSPSYAFGFGTGWGGFCSGQWIN